MKPKTIELTEKLFQLWEDLAEAGELQINHKFTPAYNAVKKEIDELKNQKISKKYFVWDGINAELEEFETVEEAKKFITETFIDDSEGIHPDIESVIILEQIFDTVVEEIQGKEEEYKVVFRNNI